MRYNLLLVGPSRSGTTSLWNCLRHPNITNSIIKEPLTMARRKAVDFDTYVDESFMLDFNTKIIFDGTAFGIGNIMDARKCLQKLKKIKEIRKIKYILLFRNPKDRSISSAFWSLYLFHKGDAYFQKKRPRFINEKGELVKEKFVKGIIEQMKCCRRTFMIVADQIGIENIFVTNIEKIQSEKKKLFNFLELEDHSLNISRYNSSKNKILSLKHLKEKQKMLEEYKKNEKVFDRYCDIEIKKMRQLYE